MPAEEAIPLIRPVRRSFPAPGERERICVLGLGNILFSDEGIGVHVAALLASSYSFLPEIDIIDGGTMGLDLLPLFQERDRILIIDAVDFRKAGGYIDLLNADAITSILHTKLSVHHIGLADLLVATKLIRETTPELCLLGIQPCSLDVGLTLTDCLHNKLDIVVEMALRKLNEWGVAEYKV